MQRATYFSDTSDPEMERNLFYALIGNGFHTRMVKTFDGVKIFGVKPDARDSATEVAAVLRDLG